jgi:hypothetical protein
VDFTAVAAGTEADTDNIFGSDLTLKMAGRIHCQPFSFPEVLSPRILCRTVPAVNPATKVASTWISPLVSFGRRD